MTDSYSPKRYTTPLASRSESTSGAVSASSRLPASQPLKPSSTYSWYACGGFDVPSLPAVRTPNLATRSCRINVLALAATALLLFACSDVNDDEGSQPHADASADQGVDSTVEPDLELQPDLDPEELEIAGSWQDGFGVSHLISNTSWTMSSEDTPEYDSEFIITQYSNGESFVLAQNHPANPFSPNDWSRFDWTYLDQELWYCHTVYDATSEEEALAETGADASDPANEGCSGWPWTRLSP